MSEEQEHRNDSKSLSEDVRLYIEKRVQLFTLRLAEQLSLIVAHSVQKLIGVLILSGAVFFLWFAFGFYLGEILDNFGLGFALSSLPLFILGFIFINRKSKRLTNRIQAELISSVMKNLEASLDINQEEKAESEEK
jgi:hypothetical protein